MGVANNRLTGGGETALLPDAAITHTSTRTFGVASAITVAAAAIGEEISSSSPTLSFCLSTPASGHCCPQSFSFQCC
ncbi:hypothetical protein [Corynebacterium atrinae]|uniref:hypothetical protein n=1 Tax=Corynebacterium atrinae TaxID=1336740 RepID=UPI0025B54467|nr:hypothetical protein [Corynebacterium atrinae]